MAKSTAETKPKEKATSASKSPKFKANRKPVKLPVKGRSGESKSLKDKFLDHLNKLHGLGLRDPVKISSVALACGYKNADTKSFRNVKKELKDEGLIQYGSDGSVQLTATAIASLPENSDAPRSNKEFQDMIKRHFNNDKNICKLIDALADGGSLLNLQAANALGYQSADSKGFRNAKKALKELKYLDGTSIIQLTDKMFPFGRNWEIGA